jgi:hypothetical protein
MNRAHAVSKVGSVVTSRAMNRAMMHCKDHRVALVRRKHFDPRLPARTLFGKDKFPSFKLPPPLAQKACDLKRKDHFAV